MEDYTLLCRLDIPGQNGISVTIPPTQLVHDLKKAIILELPVDYENTKAIDLKLYRISTKGVVKSSATATSYQQCLG
jgi:hypothetical protein